MSNKVQDGDLLFPLGQDSSTDPMGLAPGYYSRGMNVVNRGGVIQCRPGYRCLLVLPDGELQGFAVLRPKQAQEILVFGVAGKLYTSQHPFDEYQQLPGVELSPTAEQFFFKQVEDSVTQNPDGSISFDNARNLLVIQDGGFTAPVVFDGTSATHQRGPTAIPLGGPMEWIGDRLWVARGPNLYASDIGDPLSFTEATYIAGALGFFTFPEDITALHKTLTVDFAQLLVFSRTTTQVIQASIRDRATWASTPNFQKEIFPSLGCVSQRSVKAHYGLLWWFSEHGLVSLDAAATGYISSALPYQDSQMQESKGRLSQQLGGVACASYENYLLVSVPYADQFNRHTWCLDNTVNPGEAQRKPSWNSFWTGTRPVEWIVGEFDGLTRALYISKDYDGGNRLWEAFMPDRLDNNCPITWWAESRAYQFQTPGKNKDFRYADVFVSELSGTVDMAVFWAGSHRGKYKRVMTKRILANTATFKSDESFSADEILAALKKQSRPLRTQDGKAIIANENLSSCDVESPLIEFKDDGFQILVVGSGPGAVRGIIVYAEPPSNVDDSGRCEEDETEENFVRFDGAASATSSLDRALEDFANTIPVFRSSRTVTLSQDGFTEVGVGIGQSIISQQDADKIAEAMANRLAAEALKLVLPLIINREDLSE
jgi:hypothetical protein